MVLKAQAKNKLMKIGDRLKFDFIRLKRGFNVPESIRGKEMITIIGRDDALGSWSVQTKDSRLKLRLTDEQLRVGAL